MMRLRLVKETAFRLNACTSVWCRTHQQQALTLDALCVFFDNLKQTPRRLIVIQCVHQESIDTSTRQAMLAFASSRQGLNLNALLIATTILWHTFDIQTTGWGSDGFGIVTRYLTDLDNGNSSYWEEKNPEPGEIDCRRRCPESDSQGGESECNWWWNDVHG